MPSISISITIWSANDCQPEMIDQANLLIWTIHNLERLADRVINICERTIFITTGDIFEMDKEYRLFVDDEEEEDEEEDDSDFISDHPPAPEVPA